MTSNQPLAFEFDFKENHHTPKKSLAKERLEQRKQMLSESDEKMMNVEMVNEKLIKA